MGAVFEDVKIELLAAEGLYSNDPDDPGRETKYGISAASYPNLDIKSLTENQALEIYERDFWVKFHLSEFKTQSVANKVMLGIINMGDEGAIACLQRAICRCGLFVTVDGELGRMTITGANTVPQFWVLDRLKLEYAYYYLTLVDRNSKRRKFLEGWLRRALA